MFFPHIRFQFLVMFSLLISLASIADEVGRKGGVTHTPAKNQESSQICWAYTVTGLAEGEFMKKNPGKMLRVSPEYLGFYHIYFQLKYHLGYFTKLAEELEALPNDEEGSARQNAILKAYDLLEEANESLNVEDDEFFAPDMGSIGATLLDEVEKVGMVPANLFTLKITSEEQENRIEAGLKSFIGMHMLNPDDLKDYIVDDDDGINSPLFNALAESLYYALGARPLRPLEKFDFYGRKLNAHQFMNYILKFDPDKYVAIESSQDTHELALEAVVQILASNQAVPLGLTFFKDQLKRNGPTSSEQVQDSGIFTTNYCPNNHCKETDGGHEMLAVNWLMNNGKLSYIIVKNSWGEDSGFTVDGEANSNSTGRGFYKVEPNYLKNGIEVDDAWDFILPKKVANLSKYRGLHRQSKAK